MVRLDLNLLPPRKQLIGKQGRGILLAFVFVLLLLVLVYVGLQGVVNSTRAQITQVQAELAQYGSFEQTLLQLDQLEKQVRSSEAYLQQLLGKLHDWYSVTINLARNIPNQVALTSITGDANAQINIKGSAPSALEVSRLYFSLRNATTTASIAVNSISPQSGGSWTFDMTYQAQRATP
jgi:Tfp pilus assembly protein PilN